MKKKTMIVFESAQPMTATQIVDVISEARSEMRNAYRNAGTEESPEPRITMNGDHGDVYKITATIVEVVER